MPPQKAVREWAHTFLRDGKYFARAKAKDERGHKIEGLPLSVEILRKICHDIAVRWIPGI